MGNMTGNSRLPLETASNHQSPPPEPPEYYSGHWKPPPATFRSSSPVNLRRNIIQAGVGLMGTKLGMMTYFESTGIVVPVTVIGFREGNLVTQVKTEDTDGYNAVQVGYRRIRDKKLTKSEMGHLEKSGIIPLRHLQEYMLQSVDGFEPNQKLVLEELFKEGDLVDVSGTTIGKGFQGPFPLLIYILVVSGGDSPEKMIGMLPEVVSGGLNNISAVSGGGDRWLLAVSGGNLLFPVILPICGHYNKFVTHIWTNS